MSNVSLDETLFYQYMINNNSTSTMLNAISGSSTADNNSSSLLSALGGMQGMNLLGTGSIADAATLLGLSGSAAQGIGSLNGFSSVLQTYLNAEHTGIAQMTEKIEEVMEEVAGTEETESRSYQTLEEIYQYFLGQSSGSTASFLSALTGTGETASAVEEQKTASDTAPVNFDFDGFEKESDEMIESMMEEAGVNVGI